MIDYNVTRTKVKNELYRIWSDISNNRYRDQDWSGFKGAIKYLQNCLDTKYGVGVVNIRYYCQDGGYRQTSDGLSIWKEYIIEIDIVNETKIKGYINCCPCGTVEDPFSVYDLTFVIWLHNFNEE